MNIITQFKKWAAGLWASKKIDDKTEQAKQEIAAVVEEVVEIVDEAKNRAIDEVKEKGAEVRHTVRKRARDRFGRFLRDDPNTPDNEAYVEVEVDKDEKDEK